MIQSVRAQIALLTGALASLAASMALAQSEKTPNVIVVTPDEQGHGDLSAHGNPVLKTPNMDKLYSESVQFADFRVAPMCVPTLGQLMTGRDAIDDGASFVCMGRELIRAELPTMADTFQDAGYATGLLALGRQPPVSSARPWRLRGRPSCCPGAYFFGRLLR